MHKGTNGCGVLVSEHLITWILMNNFTVESRAHLKLCFFPLKVQKVFSTYFDVNRIGYVKLSFDF